MKGEALVAIQPGANLGVFVGRIVVEDHVHGLPWWHLGLNGVQEPDELLVSVTLHVAPDHGAVQHVEGCKQRGGSVAFFSGSPGWVRSSAWIWLFSSTESTMA